MITMKRKGKQIIYKEDLITYYGEKNTIFTFDHMQTGDKFPE